MKLVRKVKLFWFMLAAAVVLMTATPALSWGGYRHHNRPYYGGYYGHRYHHGAYSRGYYGGYYGHRSYYRPYYRYGYGYPFFWPGFSFYVGP
ncbi:MAG: hypothetical protein WAW37_02525 [Syntrophobacteraceae bacterium]